MSVEITPYLASAVIGIISASITGYAVTNYAIKRAKKEVPNMITEYTTQFLKNIPSLLSDADIQKGVYSIGLIIGNGAKQGLGFAPAGKSPKGLMGLVSQVLPMFLKGNPTVQAATEAVNEVNPFNVG